MKLWNYLNQEYGLLLLDSEIHDILELARQEIELPTEEEIRQSCPQELPPRVSSWIQGVAWAIRKVREPYLKPM
jgi:hypothetical protein